MNTTMLVVFALVLGALVLTALIKLLNKDGTHSSRLADGPRKIAPRGMETIQATAVSEHKHKEFQKAMAERILRPLAGIMHIKGEGQNRLVERLVHAGIRKKGAAEIFLGAKVALCLALPAATAAFVLWRASLSDLPVSSKNLVLYCSCAMMAGMMLPNIWLSRKGKARMEQIRFALPDALDLLVVCVESGLAPDAAFVRLAREMKSSAPELSEEFTLMNLEVSAGKPREDCLRNLGLRTGVDEAKALAARIIQSTKFGTNLAHSLRIHADSLRQKRRQEAEERAAKTTVKLLFPLVFFIFPAIFVVILGPAMVNVKQVFGA